MKVQMNDGDIKVIGITYKDIEKVNSEIVGIDLKGKNYAMVAERVTAFRKLYPEGFIQTKILINDGTTILMEAKAGYYREDGSEVVLATGHAQEIRGKGLVNGTSHVENCETGAVGRCLGLIGIGQNGGGICSAEELVNAITAQKQMEDDFEKTKREIEARKIAEMDGNIRKDAPANVTTAEKMPWEEK